VPPAVRWTFRKARFFIVEALGARSLPGHSKARGAEGRRLVARVNGAVGPFPRRAAEGSANKKTFQLDCRRA
jgi:hypothetical protein